MTARTALARSLPSAVAPALPATGCGSSDSATPKPPPGVSKKDFAAELAAASSATAADFPATNGRTLQQMADTAQAGNQVGFASSVFTPGANRLAFGVVDKANAFVYGKSAVYVARDPGAPALGPYPAPADSLLTKPAFRSQNAAVESSPIAQIYAAQVPLPRAGDWRVGVVTKQGDKL